MSMTYPAAERHDLLNQLHPLTAILLLSCLDDKQQTHTHSHTDRSPRTTDRRRSKRMMLKERTLNINTTVTPWRAEKQK